MNRALARSIFQAKSIFCVALLLSMHVVAGCGTVPNVFAGGSYVVNLTSDHPLASALAGTPFDGASAMEVNPLTRQFRLIYPDGSRHVSGTFTESGGEKAVNSLSIGVNSNVITLDFNALRQITEINTGGGQNWRRPGFNTQPAQAPSAPAPFARSIDDEMQSYMTANADLLQAAAEFDAQQSDGFKAGDPAGFGPWAIIAVFAWISATTVGALIFVFQVAVVLGLVL